MVIVFLLLKLFNCLLATVVLVKILLVDLLEELLREQSEEVPANVKGVEDVSGIV